MEPASRNFLDRLLATPGVSGFEQQVQQVVRDYVQEFADETTTDMHGNLFVAVNPRAETRVMLAGHADQIGLIVSWIDDNGFLFFQTVGGWDPQQLVGQKVIVWSAQGPVNGVIARKPIHLQDESERKQVANIKALWIDIGCRTKDEADSLVRIGDSATLRMEHHELQNSLLAGPALDNRSGVWVVIEGLRRAKQLGATCGVWAVSTVQEEIGLRGAQTAAYTIAPQIGIAVDVTHATDCPEMDRKQLGHIRVGDGPVVVHGPNTNPEVVSRLMGLSKTKSIPVQAAALGKAASNDGNVLQISRGGVAAGIVAVPNRYMHSGVETVSLHDLDYAATLLAEFCCTVQSPEEFIPRLAGLAAG